VVMVVPCLILFLLLQRYYVRGVLSRQGLTRRGAAACENPRQDCLIGPIAARISRAQCISAERPRLEDCLKPSRLQSDMCPTQTTAKAGCEYWRKQFAAEVLISMRDDGRVRGRQVGSVRVTERR
jgi:hypothetical protein